jgi:hypothetical protein
MAYRGLISVVQWHFFEVNRHACPIRHETRHRQKGNSRESLERHFATSEINSTMISRSRMRDRLQQ